MKKSPEQLEQEISKLQSELQKQGEFVSMIIHQLRTPLTGTKWTFRMLLDGDFAAFTPQQNNILEQGFKSNERMIGLLEEMSLANKTRTWHFQYVKEPTDLEEVIEHIITEFLPDARAHHKSIKFQRPQEKRFIDGDANKIGIVFENLIDNAIKYTPDESTITISLSYENDSAKVTVHNTHCTTSEKDLESIFGKFKRGSNVQEVHGTGLGLFTVKRIIEDHSGSVTFSAGEEIGTTVTLAIPLLEIKDN